MKRTMIFFSLLLTATAELSDSELAEQLYINLFKKRRIEQLEAVKSIRKLSYKKQYSMIMLSSEHIFAVIQDSRAAIEASPFIPGVSDFPLDEKIQEALSNIIENTALFSEMVLRYPDIAHSLLEDNNNWDLMLQWSVAFCNQINYLLDKSTKKLLRLVSQELNHVERDANYHNPYKVEIQTETPSEVLMKKKVKKKIKKGPKMSGHFEL